MTPAASVARPPSPTTATVPPTAPDFARPLVMLLGLPFDAVTLADAVARVRDAAFAHRRLFVSTPNLDFAVTALHDAEFRGSVLRSDLSLVDGMPLVWLARWLGVSVPGRVAGADLFDALRRHPGPPLGVFLFGGPPGVAAAASAALNAEGGGLICVGHDEAGHGDIASMSDDARIARINASGAHFVAVALGARKGQVWIEHNAPRLHAPVLSHLGATLNFAAGSVRRAPMWMRRMGLEWLWRIREEPTLWRRYAGDAATLLSLVPTRIVPAALAARRPSVHRPPPTLAVVDGPESHRVVLGGAWDDDALAPLRAALQTAAHAAHPVVVDLSNATHLGNGVIALLAVAQASLGTRPGLRVHRANPAVQREFTRLLCDGWLQT